MANYTEGTERNKTVQVLIKQGFHLQFSNANYSLLAKQRSESTMWVASVDNDGMVFKQPLSEFLQELLNGNNQGND